MKSEPQISVAMSTFNPKEDALRRAVQSVIDQSFESWELLLYDDGSDCEKSKVIRRIADLDKRIRYLRGNINQGLAAGLNMCIKEAAGKYIARMDDDDICLSSRFERQWEFLNSHKEYEWVGVLADLFDNNGVWGRADRPEKPDKTDFFHSSPFIHPGVMFRREVLLNTGGYRVTKATSRCEDYELFMRLYSRGYRGYNMQEVLLQYREDSRILKRSWKYCYYEAVIRLHGYKQLKILSPKAILYVLKPLGVRTLTIFPRLAQKIRVNRKKGDHSVDGNGN